MSEPKMQPGRVRVRIAVAVGPDGTWSASSWSGADTDDVKMAIADSMDSETIRWSWVEADVPMPEPEETVQGVVAVAELIETKLGREDCDSFEPGEPKGQCDGDGHFLCRQCKEWNKPSPLREGGE
ncbi:MAG: hypothetical protein WC565_03890 [Parcubacteria group bacterium]